mgnify:FL=1
MREADKLNDKEMREVLFDYYESTNERLRIFEELCIAKSRADAILVRENCLIGFEIKSDRDSLERLESQVKNYSKFCNLCYIVTGNKHIDKITEYVPETYGIIKIFYDENKKLSLEIVREATRKPKEALKRKLKHQLSLLWRPEIVSIAKANKVKPISGKSKPKIATMLVEQVPFDILQGAICEALMERDYSIYLEKEDAEA